MRKRWNARIAKLLIAMLLVQWVPALHGGPLAVTAAASKETVTMSTYGPSLPVGKITDYTWEKVTIAGFSPVARHAASMAYDEMAGNVVLFGGQGDTSLLRETLIWDGSQQTWTEMLHLADHQPSARKGAVMAYDPNSRKVLLFGGEGAGASLQGDTWLWDGMAAEWVNVTGDLATAPSARAGAQLAFNGEQLVLFGGYTISGGKKIAHDDTWLWDGTTRTWTEAEPAQSPPAVYNGQMVYDGSTAFLYGGNAGEVTEYITVGGSPEARVLDGSPPLVWTWDKTNGNWISTDGPRQYGRWGHAMAYDGRRVVFFSGERDYVSSYNPTLVKNVRLPSSRLHEMRGAYVNEPDYYSSIMAFGWTGTAWERYAYEQFVYTESEYLETPNTMPFPMSYASMAFDGENFVLFGGHRGPITVREDGKQVGTWPESNMNETWTFAYREAAMPGVKFDDDPDDDNDSPVLINYDDDVVSVVTNVYSDGYRAIESSGIQYRLHSESGDGEWTSMPYTGTQGKGSFTVSLTELTWHQTYEVRGYAENELGRSYTEIVTFMLFNDPNMDPPDIRFDRVGASVLHVKDKKRIVAVGADVTNLLRKSLSDIHYFLKDKDGFEYRLNYNVLNNRQLELTWTDDLLPGTYDVLLEHAFYDDYPFIDALQLTALDFYKPRNFAKIEVPSTSEGNDVDRLVLQGLFTEEPTAPNVYVLADPSEIVTINESVMFKGSSLIVDKSATSGKITINGNGRLFVNGSSALGTSMSYTLHDGEFALSSDNFSFALDNIEASDYLGIDMPIKASSIVFTQKGLRLSGDLSIRLQAGSRKLTNSVQVEDVIFNNNRFDWSGTVEMDSLTQIGPIKVEDAQVAINSRMPYVGIQGKGSLPNTSMGFHLDMTTKQGYLDAIKFALYGKATKLASSGLQIDYMFGNVTGLAEKTQIPQKLPVTGSVRDVIVPSLMHPQAFYSFNLIGTDTLDMEITPHGLSAVGTEYYYWLPVNNMSMQAITSPAAAAMKGVSTQGVLTSGEINVFDIVKGAIGAYSFNKKDFTGIIKGTVYVPKGIPRIGGATVRDVTLSVNDNAISGVFKHNGVGSRVTYTFKNNTVLFEVEAEPPKKSWWDKTLDFMNNVNDFMEKLEPWAELAEELLLMNPFDKNSNKVQVLSDAPLKKVYDLKPISLSFQPEDTTQVDARARIVDGQLTAIDQTPLLTTDASNGQWTAEFEVRHDQDALLTLTGDQRSIVLQAPDRAGKAAGSPVHSEAYYDATHDVTYLRVSLTAGNWKLLGGGASRVNVNELTFANADLSLQELSEQWAQAPERSVTSLYVAERGSYVLKIGAVQGDVIVYKPDGRPYRLQTLQTQPDWNAYHALNGDLYVIVNAVQAGTWIISAGGSPTAELNSLSAQTEIGLVAEWVQNQTYSTTFDLKQTGNGQVIVEIYGADELTELIAPNGSPYVLQTNPIVTDMNAHYDEAAQKLTVLLDRVELPGQWTVKGSGFTSVIAYEASRKFKSIKPLLMEGRFTKFFELAGNGDYMLTVSGGDAETVIKSPDGLIYALNFDTPTGNAYIQSAADRVPEAIGGGDPREQTQVVTPNPVQDGRDTLYVSLLNASAGRWSVQTSNRTELQIQKLIPLPEIEASVTQASSTVNRINVTWSMKHAPSNAEVTMTLMSDADQLIGEVIAAGLPASGSMSVDIPASTMPGTYYLSVIGGSAGDALVYAIAEDTVEVTASMTLQMPEKPEVISTGNGEVTLRFASIPGNVTAYRIWSGNGLSGQAEQWLMDIVPEPGDWQTAVITGLSAEATYDISVSAIGLDQERIVTSPSSDIVTTELPLPQPTALTVALDAGAAAVSEQPYTAYDNTQTMLLLTDAEQASVQVSADQDAELTLYVHGQQVGSGQVLAGETYSFPLHNLLNVSMLKERDYSLLIEAVNTRGDRSVAYRKLFVDRTGPLLIASGGDDANGQPISLNGSVTADSKIYITGQTDSGATLEIEGTVVPLDDEGRFVYYAPLDWTAESGEDPPVRHVVKVTASDAIGNKTEHGFEVLRESSEEPIVTYLNDLAALTTSGASMNMPYAFGMTSYSTFANSDKVRIYAVPMNTSAGITIDGEPITEAGYVEVEVTASSRTVPIVVSASGVSNKQYSLQIQASGSNVAALQKLTLMHGDTVLEGPNFTGAEALFSIGVDHDVNSVTLTPEALMLGSEILVNTDQVQSGQASQAISLQAGDNLISLSVTSPDNAVTRTYQVNVWRTPSSNALLQDLGLDTDGAELTAAFHPATLHHQVLVPYYTEEVKLLPVAEQSDATISINGHVITNHTVRTIPFTGDMQTLAIEVSAQDGTILMYNVSVLRRQSLPEQPPLLSSLQTEGTLLDGAFNPYKLNYNTVYATGASVLSVVAQADNTEAVVTVGNVALTGGGSFKTKLTPGNNTVIVSVESSDRKVSQTYSIDVLHIPPSENQDINVRQSTISGGLGGWSVQTPIIRSKTSDGRTIDSVSLNAENARSILNMVADNNDHVVSVYVTDVPGAPADERIANLNAAFVALLANSGVSLQIIMPDAQITLSSVLLLQLHATGKDAYFRVVPIHAEAERDEVVSRVQGAELVLQSAEGQPISILGQPVKIETNYSGFNTEIVFPLDHLTLPNNEMLAKQYLANLIVYIEHSDGDKALSQGELRYDEFGKLIGIAIEIEKFSTFTIIRTGDDKLFKVWNPYLSGYPDDSFRPSQSITRAEMASILHNMTADSALNDTGVAETVSYPDVVERHWASVAIASMRHAGLMLGDHNGLFRPGDAVTRGEMASIVARLLPAAELSNVQAETYSDVLGHWAATAIEAASQVGIFQGYPDDTFRPENKLNRAEAVAVLNRLYERPVVSAQSSSWPDVPRDHWAIKEIVSASSTVIQLPDGSAYIESNLD